MLFGSLVLEEQKAQEGREGRCFTCHLVPSLPDLSEKSPYGSSWGSPLSPWAPGQQWTPDTAGVLSNPGFATAQHPGEERSKRGCRKRRGAPHAASGLAPDARNPPQADRVRISSGKGWKNNGAPGTEPPGARTKPCSTCEVCAPQDVGSRGRREPSAAAAWSRCPSSSTPGVGGGGRGRGPRCA